LRVVFIGIELCVLDALRACPVDLLGVYLPDPPRSAKPRRAIPFRPRKKARSRLAHRDALAARLAERQIRALPGPHVNHPEFIETLRTLDPDLGIVANFGEILSEPLLCIPRLGFINLHPSLLPRYRGPQPLGHILLNGEAVSGTSWHRIARAVDSGDVLSQAAFEIEAGDTTRDLWAKSITLGIALLPPLLRALERGDAMEQPQDENQASYFPKLTRREKRRLRRMAKLA
jgi:methionyl-tRNA formyltransferase